MRRQRMRTTINDVAEATFAHTADPRGPIIDEAARTIAQLLWTAAAAVVRAERSTSKRDDPPKPPPANGKEKPEPASSLVDTKRAAEILGVKPQTLALWRCDGRRSLPYIRVGRLVRYRLGDIEAFLESSTIGASRSAGTSR